MLSAITRSNPQNIKIRFRQILLRLKPQRLRVMLQQNPVECGVACLAMILNYHGQRTTVSSCRIAFGLSRDGISAQDIISVARTYGLDARGYSAPISELQTVKLPAIAYMANKHFVVLEAIQSNKLRVIDPEVGRTALTVAEFSTDYSGVVLTFQPTENTMPDANQQRSLSLRTHFKAILFNRAVIAPLLLILGLSFFVQILGLTAPLLTRFIIDDIATGNMPISGSSIAAGLLLLLLSQFVVHFCRGFLLVQIQQHLENAMLRRFFQHLLQLPFQFFQIRNSGDLLMRFDSNNVIRDLLTNRSISLVLDCLFVLVYLAALVSMDASFAILTVALASVQLLALFLSVQRFRKLNEQSITAQSQTQSYLVEVLRNILQLKASGSEVAAFEKWSQHFDWQLQTTKQRDRFASLMDSIISTLRYLAPLMLLSVGIFEVIDGSMSLGTLFALNALATAFLVPLASIVITGQQIQWAFVHLDRLADILRAYPEQYHQKTKELARINGDISLQNVSFQYNAHAGYILNHITLSIEVGQSVAIVGPTGSGKSTLALLLAGLYEPVHGTIHYSGHNLQALNYQHLRQQTGMVLQETTLFGGSIRDNICQNRPDVADDEIVAAAKIACIHDDILQMPLQYQTEILEGGMGLSGGQRQRIALARAIIHQPRLLILDEATSHLDVTTENRVIKELDKLPVTRISIAHRLSTVRNADLIVFLNEGEIVESGTHESLMQEQGAYYEFARQQLES